MIDAVLLDFYGTVVHEDDVIVDRICATIRQSAKVGVTEQEIGTYWWGVFSDGFKRSYGADFQTQRDLEVASLAQTVERFGAECDADELSRSLFAHWERPSMFDDAVQFLESVDVPLVVVSNIDRCDIEAAIDYHGLKFEHVITSEDIRSYKPRPELFVAGLAAVDCPADRALHVGDSLTSDLAGAHELGIPVAWINRTGKPSPVSAGPTFEAQSLADLTASILS